MPQAWLMGLIGGVVLGAASAILLAMNGRILGVSGIVGGAVMPKRGDLGWRVALLGGLLVGGLVLRIAFPDAFDAVASRSAGVTIVAGLLVGFGTRLGSGCTSGHGICGVSRLSPRSLAATIVFVFAGMVTASLFHAMR